MKTGDLTGGVMAALVVLPGILNCGVIAFQPLGPDYAATGILAAFTAAIVVGLLRGLWSRAPIVLVSPKTTYAAIVAALLWQLGSTPAFESAFTGRPQERAAALIAAAFLVTAVSGITQLAFGLLRLGSVIKFMPFPVTAGFVNGFALRIIAAQWTDLGAGLWTVSLGLFAAATAVFAPRIDPRIPGPLAGLALGTLLYHLLGFPEMGGLIGQLPSGLPFSPQTGAALSSTWKTVLPPVFATGTTLGLICALQSLIVASGADVRQGTRSDSDKELVSQGIGNLLCAFLGGLPTAGSPSGTNTAWSSGARSQKAALWHAGALLAVCMGLGYWVGLIPLSVMAGVVVVNTFTGTDEWTWELLRKLSRRSSQADRRTVLLNLSLIGLVTVLVVFASVPAALLAGMAATFLLFLRQSAGSAVRRVSTGRRSMTARPSQESDLLSLHGSEIAVIELQGPLYFGSAEQVALQAEELSRKSSFLIADLSRVTDIESTGALALMRLDALLSKRGKKLILSGLDAERPLQRFLRDVGFSAPEKEGRLADNVEAGLAQAEDLLLLKLGHVRKAQGEEPLERHEAFSGMTTAQLAAACALLTRKEFSAGDLILSEGGTDRSLYFLAAGRISVSKRLGSRRIRLAGYRPGVLFGEMAALTGMERSAEVSADEDAVCYKLKQADLAKLETEHPAAAAALLRNVARAMAYRMRDISTSLAESQR